MTLKATTVREVDNYLNRDIVYEPVTSQEECQTTVRKKERDRKGRGGCKMRSD